MLWKGFQRPKRLEFERETLTDRFGRFYAQPFERGFGTTIGNALRRVLLSSIEGAAITAVKIDGVLHEFSPIPGVVEDATDIILNLKQIPLKLHVDYTKTLYLRVEKAGEVKARDIQTDADVEILEPDARIATVSEGTLTKGLIAAFIGLMIATVGTDPVSGVGRFTYGNPELLTGVPVVLVMVGLFAVSEVLEQASLPGWEKVTNTLMLVKFPSWKLQRRLVVPNIIGCVVGTFCGVMPGAGGTVASFMAYNESKRFSRHKEEFGKGSPESVAAAENANNCDAAVGLICELPRLLARRPGLRCEGAARHRFMRVDAAREQRLQPRIDARFAERPPDERVEAECRQMTFVEDEGMTERDGPRVVSGLVEEIEQRSRMCTIPEIPVDGGFAVEGRHRARRRP